MTRSTNPLLTLALVAAFSGAAAAQPAAKTPPTEARGAARVLLEQAAFEEEHERDYERAIRLFEQAVTQATRAQASKLIAEAKLGLVRCRAKLGKGRPAPLPPHAYATLKNPLTLVYGDRLVPVLLQAARAGHVFSPQGRRHDLAPVAAMEQLAKLRTPKAVEALEQLLGARDPVLKILAVSVLQSPFHDPRLLRALADPLPEVRDEAAAAVSSSERKELTPELARALRAAAAKGSKAALGALERHPDELIPLARDLVGSGSPLWKKAVEALESSWNSSTLDEEKVRVVVQAAELRGYDIESSKLLPQLSGRFWALPEGFEKLPLDLYARIERVLLGLDYSWNTGDRIKLLLSALRSVAGRATLERLQRGDRFWNDEAGLRTAACQTIARNPERLRGYRTWLAADLARLGSAAEWQSTLSALCRALAIWVWRPAKRGYDKDGKPLEIKRYRGPTAASDEHLMALVGLTLKRFPAEGRQIVLISMREGVFSESSQADESRLEKLVPGLALASGGGTLDSYARYLSRPRDCDWSPRLGLLRGYAELTPAQVLDLLPRAHPDKRREALDFALQFRGDLGEKQGTPGVDAFERALVARLQRGERFEFAPRLLQAIHDDGAWLRVAKSEIAHVSTLTAPALAKGCAQHDASFAVRVLPLAAAHLNNLGSRSFGGTSLKTLWQKLSLRFPAESAQATAATLRRIASAEKERGEWKELYLGRLLDLGTTLMSAHPRRWELFLQTREELAGSRIQGELAGDLVPKVGRSLPVSALEVLVECGPDSSSYRKDLLKAVERTLNLGLLGFVEKCLQDSDYGVREEAEDVIEAFTKAKDRNDSLERLKTGVDSKELRELAKLLDDPAPEVALGAARAMGRLGDPAALPLLVRRLRGAKPELKKSLLDAIDALTPAKPAPQEER